ncbi:MAG: magnesium protoporphyrin IX methyltransferase [Sphingomonadales bacterium]
MTNTAYEARRGQLQNYFGQTAADKWVALTSNSPVSKIRETVRAGRESMRDTLLGWMPEDLKGARILEAGCGPGVLSIEAAKRGADVLAVVLSPALIDVAKERTPKDLGGGSIDYRTGDMTEESFGQFDYVIAMDSLIHYPFKTIVDLLTVFSARANEAVFFTVAPKTPLLSAMHVTGKLFPRNDRSPAIVPVSEKKMSDTVAASEHFDGAKIKRTQRISSAFYQSQAMELTAK